MRCNALSYGGGAGEVCKLGVVCGSKADHLTSPHPLPSKLEILILKKIQLGMLDEVDDLFTTYSVSQKRGCKNPKV